jgi:hypothetical protein
MLVDTVSSEAAIPCVDDCSWAEAPDPVLCVDSTIETFVSLSSYAVTIKAAGRYHGVGVFVQRGASPVSVSKRADCRGGSLENASVGR